ncbi:MAG: SusC/RagA family TonB-linked outer membrane protein, partial [Gemmatimonadaceae bacterium]
MIVVPTPLVAHAATPRPSTTVPHSAVFAGTISGKITDKSTGEAVTSAQVVINGTRFGALTDNGGNFSIRNVPAGTVTLRTIRIGYQPQTKTVTVSDGGDVRADFALDRATALLEEVVTTATGEQSRRSFGNVVATIKADSLAQLAPVTSVNEMLEGRTSGLQIIQASGQTGASSFIRIRGTSSLSLSNEPLVIIDGVRYDNNTLPGGLGNTTTQRINRLSELNPEEVESIDIIKGPSAAALYGTAAANGVLVVKTKRGHQGKAEWNAFFETGRVTQPSSFEPNWRSWGHNLSSGGVPTGGVVQCKIVASSLRQCMVDSLTNFNPYLAAEAKPYKSQPRYLAGVQVSGGSDLLRYFLSLTQENETGPYQMPGFEIARLTTERGVSPRGQQIHPNQLKQTSVRANFSLNLAKNATLDVSTAYSDRTLYTPFDGGFFAGMTFQYMTAAGFKTATNGTQREFVGDIFSIEQKTADARFTGSAALNWTPIDWLQLRAVTGIDQTNQYNYRQQLNAEGTRVGVAWGPVGQEGGKDLSRSNNLRYSVDLGATASKALTSAWSSKTTVGGQWFKDELYQEDGEGYGLPPGVSSPNSARQRLSWEFTTENAQYGAFVDEALSWHDRLFLTGGVRTDQNSAFGRSVGRTVYPRASASYVISEENWFPRVPKLNRARLRAAWGKAGVQPSTIAALQFFGATTYPLGGAEVPGERIASIGNSGLRPEVTTELEFGTDLGFFRDRLAIEATYFNKKSKDALFLNPLPPSFGTSIGSAAPSQWVNLAQVRNRGVELAVDAQLLTARMLSWDVRLNGSHINNKLVDAGSVALATPPGARNVVGYPLFGLWDKPILGYKDLNGDGILTENEITVGTTDAFRGATLPVWEAGLTNTFGLFNNRIRVSALLDYRGGFYNQWGYQNQRCGSSGNCRAVNDPKAPLADQAAAVMANSSTHKTVWGFFVPNDFIRFREMSVSFNLPERFTKQFLRSRSTSVVLSGRNLGTLWTKYPGLD